MVGIGVGPYKANMDLDAKELKTNYDAWKAKVGGLRGQAIGIHSNKSLLNFIENQGIVGRVVYKKGEKQQKAPKSSGGGSYIIPLLDTMLSRGKLSFKSISALNKLHTVMVGFSRPDSQHNPRNIKYEDIDVIHRDKPKYDEEGKKYYATDKKPVYGHYRTEMYVIYRNNYKEGFNEFPGKKEWYSHETPNNSQPPMWQALYGDGTGGLNIEKSLMMVVKEAIDNLKDAEVKILPSTPINIEGQGAGKAAYEEFEELKVLIDKWVQEANTQGEKSIWMTKYGNFNDYEAEKRLMSGGHFMVKLDDKSEQEVMRRIMQVVSEDYPPNLTEVPIRINRHQIRYMAKLAGFKSQRYGTDNPSGRIGPARPSPYQIRQRAYQRRADEEAQRLKETNAPVDEEKKSWMKALIA